MNDQHDHAVHANVVSTLAMTGNVRLFTTTEMETYSIQNPHPRKELLFRKKMTLYSLPFFLEPSKVDRDMILERT